MCRLNITTPQVLYSSSIGVHRGSKFGRLWVPGNE